MFVYYVFVVSTYTLITLIVCMYSLELAMRKLHWLLQFDASDPISSDQVAVSLLCRSEWIRSNTKQRAERTPVSLLSLGPR